jgi:hypothetical protein
MNEANYASLTAGLLARKGQARPAMRPQNYGFGSDDDLGWNDMGGADLLTPEQRHALMPAQPLHQPRPAAPHDVAVASPALEQQREVAVQFEAQAPVIEEKPAPAVVEAPPAPAPITVAPRPRAAPGSKAKAAFTLRLDADRHMQLRLACVYGRTSAQQLVTAALDEYLAANFPDAAKKARKTVAN